LLRRTRERYEREHRPEVLKAAEELLATWTAGRYVRILAPLGKQVQELERSDGVVVPLGGLSTGTAQQLYLALRFGLVDHFARQAESLPIVMDDILVNFDPVRAERAARSIEDLATRHQVLYFTCHPGTPLEAAATIELPSFVRG
ncbi:MAG: ATP-binding protein, partial [Candidatus Limnocylindrales bacterium]